MSSGKNGQGTARRRAEQLRANQQHNARRNRLMAVYGTVASVIALAVVIALIVGNAAAPATPAAVPHGSVADPAGGLADADAMAIPVGRSNAPVTLSVYEDFRCSVCGRFEAADQAAYKSLIASGELRLLIHPVDLIDVMLSGTSGSLHAGNAAACAQDSGKFEAYHDVLFANQPAESADVLSADPTLITLAKQVPGLDTPAFETCVNAGRYDGWVRKNYADLTQITGGQPATPPSTLTASPSPCPTPSLPPQRRRPSPPPSTSSPSPRPPPSRPAAPRRPPLRNTNGDVEACS